MANQSAPISASEPSTAVCPKCARLYDITTATCPSDGQVLKPPGDPIIGQQHGNYLFMGRLGHGGMGRVYRGQHTVIGKDVAIKVMRNRLRRNPSIAKRFLIEAKTASRVQHQNIVNISDYGKLPNGLPFLVMEFLAGKDLGDELYDNGPLPLHRAVNVLTQVCRGLDACHREGIAHRDLKPENIMLLPREGRRDLITLPDDPGAPVTTARETHWDEVKVLDFGVAKLEEYTAELDRELSEQGMVVGSPYYLSPEQIVGIPGDHRSDIYSLGIIFFEMLTGAAPFRGPTPSRIMRQHHTTPLPELRRLNPRVGAPPEVDLLLRRATAKNPRDRHQSVAELAEELSICLGRCFFKRDLPLYLSSPQRSTLLYGMPPATKDA